MNKGEENGSLEFWESVKNHLKKTDYILEGALLYNTEKKIKEYEEQKEKYDAYSVLLEVANEQRVINPFIDRVAFYSLYEKFKGINDLNWEFLIQNVSYSLKEDVLPLAIVNLYEERFMNKTGSVLIAEAEKFVPNLQRIVEENRNCFFTLTTMYESYSEALKILFEDYDNVSILKTDIYQKGFTEDKFDYIISFPSMSAASLVNGKKDFVCKESEMVAFQNLLENNLNVGGRLVIILPARIAFGGGGISKLRQQVMKNYTVKEISELPECTLKWTGIKLYLIDIENNVPHNSDVIIRQYCDNNRSTTKSSLMSVTISNEKLVEQNKLAKQGDWNVERIFFEENPDYKRFQNSNIKKEYLGNVCEIFRGKAVKSKDSKGKIMVINISNINDYEIDYENLDSIDIDERKVASYLLDDGDLLLTARGTIIKTAVFENQTCQCIASSNLLVIRPDKKTLNSYYLKLFFDSQIGTKLIKGVQQGFGVMNISYKDLSSIEIPLPSLEEQNSVVNEYIEELRTYKETVRKAKERWKNTLEKLQKF